MKVHACLRLAALPVRCSQADLRERHHLGASLLDVGVPLNAYISALWASMAKGDLEWGGSSNSKGLIVPASGTKSLFKP
ncbi:hypothetical protein KAREA_02970 [Prescottella equi]|nr:hypothetical protein KAREA_02970 [Prescottella equi]